MVISLFNDIKADDIQLDGVTEVENLGEHRFRLRYDGTEESVARIAETCVNRGWGLTELTVERSSLDKVFAVLSNKAKQD